MRGPLVSFIVPCYKLAHYLGACLDSLLTQTYENLEVLVMDDCSPDHTQSIVARYDDPRVRYVRNQPNLGHLRNYNKGISLAAGDYIWLISADDCLRASYAVERYVSAMEENPAAAFVCCPAIGINESGEETGLLEWTRPFERPGVFDGRRFLETLAEGNCVSAASVMVRRRCYETAGAFPLDMPHAGDWYLWCLFAFHGQVLYFTDPLVGYRMHASNLSTMLIGSKRHIVRDDQAKVRWRLRQLANRAGLRKVVRTCTERLVNQYAIDFAEASPSHTPHAMAQSIELLLEEHVTADEREAILIQIYVGLADQLFGRGKLSEAAHFYRLALRQNRFLFKTTVKLALLKAERSTAAVRRAAGVFRVLLGR